MRARAGFLAVIAGVAACALACGESRSPRQLRLRWEPMEALNRGLAPGIRVEAGDDPELPLRAWAVRVDEHRPDVTTRVVVSSDADQRETAGEFAARLGARVIVNGGYFRLDRDPATHVGLLLVDGRLVDLRLPPGQPKCRQTRPQSQHCSVIIRASSLN